MEISLCMIVKNEEDTLSCCLQSIHDLVDEIIIVDTGSTDRTKEIAAEYTDKIYDFEWIDDFSAARNYSFSKATKDYIMWLDADDILTPENREAFVKMKSSADPEAKAILMTYHYSFTSDGHVERSLRRERIVKRDSGYKWEGEIHEFIKIEAEHIYISDVVITHTGRHTDADRNYHILERVIKNGDTDPANYYYYAGELERRGRRDEAIAYLEKFFADGGVNTVFYLKGCIQLHDLHLQNNDYKKALEVSSEYLPYCSDRSEFCCQLGYFYANIIKDIEEAIYWFDLATKCPYPTDIDFMVLDEFYYYKPWVELGTAYHIRGDIAKALECFKEALKYKENDAELSDIISKLSL